jgi:monolysocardiolipin acyltransferase
MTLHLPSLRKPPGALWRFGSASIMGLVGLLSKGFLYGFNRVETEGLEDFLKILDSRKGSGRKRGLVTACNHISV